MHRGWIAAGVLASAWSVATGCGSRTATFDALTAGDSGVGSGSGGNSSGSSSGGSSGSSSGSLTVDSGACPSGESLCAGTCVDEQTDDANCGGCGLACSTSCTVGRCLTMLADSFGPATAIAVDATSVYWEGPDTVYKVPLDGGVVTTLASGQAQPFGLAVDPTSVYWTNSASGGADAGSVVKVPLQGSPPTTLAAGLTWVGGTGVDATRVYWGAFPGVVVALPLAGGAASTFGTPGVSGGPCQASFVLAGGSAYWASTAGTLRTPLDGNPTVSLPAPGGPVAADSTNVYWTDVRRNVVTAPLTGGTPVTLATPSMASGGAIAADGQSVYYVRCGGSGPLCMATIMRLPVHGGSAIAIDLPQDAVPYSMAVDATSVYFIGGGGVFKVTPK